MLNIDYDLLTEKVSEYKRAKWLTYQELGDLLNMPQSALVNLIKNHAKIHFETVVRICDVLDFDLSEICTFSTKATSGDKLKYYRAKCGYSISQLSKLSGVSTDLISLIENNKRRLTPTNRQTLIKTLDLSPDSFSENEISVGEKIRETRQSLGLTQQKLCDEIGWIPRKLSAIERGICVISHDDLKVLSARLHKPIKFFM